jgi:hypothetical protein
MTWETLKMPWWKSDRFSSTSSHTCSRTHKNSVFTSQTWQLHKFVFANILSGHDILNYIFVLCPRWRVVSVSNNLSSRVRFLALSPWNFAKCIRTGRALLNNMLRRKANWMLGSGPKTWMPTYLFGKRCGRSFGQFRSDVWSALRVSQPLLAF